MITRVRIWTSPQVWVGYGFWKTGFTRFFEPNYSENRIWCSKSAVLRFENMKTAHFLPYSPYSKMRFCLNQLFVTSLSARHVVKDNAMHISRSLILSALLVWYKWGCMANGWAHSTRVSPLPSADWSGPTRRRHRRRRELFPEFMAANGRCNRRRGERLVRFRSEGRGEGAKNSS